MGRRKEIKGVTGRLEGYQTTDEATGRDYSFDANGRQQGYHNSKSDTTHNTNGRMLSKGDTSGGFFKSK
jgi:hypothetical protein